MFESLHDSTRPVDDCHQVREAMRHRDIRDIRRPDLIGAANIQVSQQVRVNGMLRRGLAGVWLGRDRLDSHQSHETLSRLSVDLLAFSSQSLAHFAAAVERSFEVQLVDTFHQCELVGVMGRWLVIETGAIDSQQFALPTNRQFGLDLNHGSTLP